MQESGRVEVNKAEKIEIYSTVSTTHFTNSIPLNAHESENVTGLSINKYTIKAINIQSVQPLKYLLEFYGSDAFNSTNLDLDTFIDEIELDMTEYPAFRVDNANQYKLNLSGLEMLYEDYDNSKELHIMLHNHSVTTKNAGAAGAVQIDIKMSPRL